MSGKLARPCQRTRPAWAWPKGQDPGFRFRSTEEVCLAVTIFFLLDKHSRNWVLVVHLVTVTNPTFETVTAIDNKRDCTARVCLD